MSVSIVIPVLNEEKALPATLARINSQQGLLETIVVDGGSTDASQQILREAGNIKLLSAGRGRARQMNAGADMAQGEWLLFLHADTLLPADALLEILSRGAQSGVQAGCFRHRFSDGGLLLSLISKLHNWRFRRGGIIYGDQAFFIRRELFNRLGGFPLVPILEDVQLSEQLVAITRPVMLDKTVITDSRKFVQRGVIRSFLEVAIILICYELRLPIKAQGFFAAIR